MDDHHGNGLRKEGDGDRRVGRAEPLPVAGDGRELEDIRRVGRRLTDDQYRGLAEVPPALEWFANLPNPHTRRNYRIDVEDFSRFVGIRRPGEFRDVTRAMVIAWRKDLEARTA